MMLSEEALCMIRVFVNTYNYDKFCFHKLDMLWNHPEKSSCGINNTNPTNSYWDSILQILPVTIKKKIAMLPSFLCK